MHRISNKVHTLFTFFCLLAAMNVPSFRFRNFLYRLCGISIGTGVHIASHVYFDEWFPELIAIGDHVDLGTGVMILCHDSIERCMTGKIPVPSGRVVIHNHVYVGAGTIILPGVTIGKRSIIGAGALVNKDVPPHSVAVGVPARVIKSTDEYLYQKNHPAPPEKISSG